ncbi:unnamed protein product [Mesocestoides corti]|uniref:Dynein assembly factor 1, axonemal homolog n=1 Tax=Mesocestoides corti TaxID=53468 RepID=A0A0R3UIJ3_MESCO|nr:unnamed protein product [Mesocestoides corti]
MKEDDVEHSHAARRTIAHQIDSWHRKWRLAHPLSSGPLYQLLDLHLDHAGLRYLPPGVLGALPCLRTLWLRENKLKSLNGGLLRCSCITELKIDGNYLTSIQGELRSLHCLRVLTATRNNIENVKESLDELRQIHRLEVVDFRENPMTSKAGYALTVWKTLLSLSVLDGRGKFQDSASIAAVKCRRMCEGFERR